MLAEFNLGIAAGRHQIVEKLNIAACFKVFRCGVSRHSSGTSPVEQRQGAYDFLQGTDLRPQKAPLVRRPPIT
jgi:hypothetical protein